MKQVLRSRLARLLLDAFGDREKRDAISWLALFCGLVVEKDCPELSLTDFLEQGRMAFHEGFDTAEGALAHLAGSGKLLRLRQRDTGEILPAWMAEQVCEGSWVIEPEPDVRASFAAISERAKIYGHLVKRLEQSQATHHSRDPLRKAVAEAALCFNTGLFFEAHEHLEHYWMVQPKGPTRQFLQAIIQISVGFHHASAGNYSGAANQLAKGLEKTAGISGEQFGLDCDDFLPKVAAARELMVKSGRSGRRPMPLSQIPRMPVRW